jgi:hypothetical protein
LVFKALGFVRGPCQAVVGLRIYFFKVLSKACYYELLSIALASTISVLINAKTGLRIPVIAREFGF